MKTAEVRVAVDILVDVPDETDQEELETKLRQDLKSDLSGADITFEEISDVEVMRIREQDKD